jgi:DNA gyrase subunit A
MVKDDTALLKEFDRIAKSKKLIEKKLIEELHEVDERLSAWVKQKDLEKNQLQKKIEKEMGKKVPKTKIKKK